MKGTLLGVAVSESKNQRLGRRGWGHIPDHLASTRVSRGGNLCPSLLSLRGRQAGGKAWVGFPELPQAWERLSLIFGVLERMSAKEEGVGLVPKVSASGQDALRWAESW